MITFKRKLSGNKGFTLAELLVVIAILAILIAIAVPVFSGMVADSNLRVNQANVRTVRSAAVAKILSHPDYYADNEGKTLFTTAGLTDASKYASETKPKLNWGLEKGAGWVAIAKVDNNGDIDDLKIYVVRPTSGNWNQTYGYYNGIYTAEVTADNMVKKTDKDVTSGANQFYVMRDPANVDDPFATVRPKSSDGTRPYYWVQAVIRDLENNK